MTNIYNFKGYNHNEWIYFLEKVINFLLVFGSIINLAVFAFLGLKVAGLTSFISFSIIGLGKLAIVIIKYFNTSDLWNK